MKLIDSPEAMLAAVKEYGILPLFKVGVSGWSVEEQTAPGYWFWDDAADVLGPWDWKVDVVQSGEIAYGKFIGGKASFATVEYYRELMNWRRSLPKYHVDDNNPLAAVVLDAIRTNGTMEAKGLRQIAGVKKSVLDGVMAFLQMGTWTVIGDITRVYRGPNLTYSGWQRASNTTPEGLFPEISPLASLGRNDKGKGGSAISGGEAVISSGAEKSRPGQASGTPARRPFWASIIEPEEPAPAISRTPLESREFLISHVQSLFPAANRKILEKVI